VPITPSRATVSQPRSSKLERRFACGAVGQGLICSRVSSTRMSPRAANRRLWPMAIGEMNYLRPGISGACRF
jgi:hypothetical protein